MEEGLRDLINEELDALRTLRDEFRVRAHLGKAEAREHWAKLESSWEHVEAKLEVLAQPSKESAEEVAEAAKLLVEEILDGTRRLRDLL